MRRSLFIIIGKIMAEEGAPRLTLECFRGIIIRLCLDIGNMSSDEEFWPLASNFFAGILTDFKEKLCRPGGERPVDWAY